MTRPRVALVATCYFAGSHADVLGTPLIEGYPWEGAQVESRVQVVSLYLEQLDHHDPKPRSDIGVEITDRNGVPRFATVAEAIGLGHPGVNVDGVVIIGEHGDYEVNEYGQQLYPRRRLFDSAVSAMIAAGRTAPIFTDKHLAWSFTDARAMVDTAARLGIPVLAGSSVPLSWRIPAGIQWPPGEPMTDAVVVSYGPTERYGFHHLEVLQAHAERRAGGETGVVAVQGLSGDAAHRTIADGAVDSALLDQALVTFDLDVEQRELTKCSAKDVFLIDYADGLRAAVVNCEQGIKNWGTACRGPKHEMACQIWLPGAPHSNFLFLVRQIEAMMLTGTPPYPVERTLLTTGILDAAMHSRHDGGARRNTPELAIAYQPPTDVPDTGIDLPLP